MIDLDSDFPCFMDIHRSCKTDDPNNMINRIPEALEWAPEEYIQYENILQRLSKKNYKLFKTKICQRGKHDELRGYSQFIDILSELLGYKYLEEQGYKRIEFIEEEQNRRTPDLASYKRARLSCLLELKRVHTSDADEREWQKASRPMQVRTGTVETGLKDEFEGKINDSISVAKEQLFKYCSSRSVRKIIYLLINMDLEYALDKRDWSNWDELTSFLEEQNEKESEFELIWEYEGRCAPKQERKHSIGRSMKKICRLRRCFMSWLRRR